MGNNLIVDSKVSQIEDILAFPSEIINNIEIEDSQENLNNLKVWRFYENTDGIIKSGPVILPNICKDKFMLDSHEAYIVLLIARGKQDLTEISTFPMNLWAIIESSANMTPRGLKYAFSLSNEKSENLESFMLSKRNFSNSDFKYVLFIWNGKNCSSQIKSSVLMNGFDLDKKISNPEILPFLYHGYHIYKINKDYYVKKASIVNFNEIINNTLDNMHDDVLSTPSSDTIYNYQETVYLLNWLYPNINKSNEKRQVNKFLKRVIFPKFNQNFINSTEKCKYNDCFTILNDKYFNIPLEDNKTTTVFLEKSNQRLDKIVNAKNENLDKSKENINNHDNLMDVDEENNSQSIQSIDNDEDALAQDEEDIDILDDNEEDSLNDINFTDIIPLTNNKLEVKKLNIDGIHKNLSRNVNEDDTNPDYKKQIAIPKLSLKLQHKISNPTDRSKQLCEEEEKLDSLGSTTIKKASEIIKGKLQISDKAKSLNLNFKNITNKIDLNSITENDENMETESNRKDLLMNYFSKNLSEIIEGFLFLGSYNAAKNKELVFKNKITHIINSATDVCQNHFEKDIKYLNFYLKDHSMEVIYLNY